MDAWNQAASNLPGIPKLPFYLTLSSAHGLLPLTSSPHRLLPHRRVPLPSSPHMLGLQVRASGVQLGGPRSRQRHPCVIKAWRLRPRVRLVFLWPTIQVAFHVLDLVDQTPSFRKRHGGEVVAGATLKRTRRRVSDAVS